WARGGVIGHQGRLPWHYPEDLRHFRTQTLGHAIVMGARTWQSIGRPLPGRNNIVLSRGPAQAVAGVTWRHTLADALSVAWQSDSTPRIIGGATLYAQALPLVTELIVTHIDADHPGDCHFPAVDWDAWRCVSEVASHAAPLRYCRYLRRESAGGRRREVGDVEEHDTGALDIPKAPLSQSMACKAPLFLRRAHRSGSATDCNRAPHCPQAIV
ncbi:MAG: dihydrofolate reductase, partial [Polyangiales bacterium]